MTKCCRWVTHTAKKMKVTYLRCKADNGVIYKTPLNNLWCKECNSRKTVDETYPVPLGIGMSYKV